MNIIIFGASSTIGLPLIEQSLQEGHQVTAFCRNPAKIELDHPHLQKIAGDVLDLTSVKSALEGNDVVYVSLGSGKDRKSTIRSRGTQNVISGMKELGLTRLICQTTLGTGDSHHTLNFFWKHIMFGWFLKQVFLDHELQEQYVRESGLDWTIVRPSAFQNGKRTGKYQFGSGEHFRPKTLKISRADVAEFMLKQGQSTQFLFQTPGVSC